MFCFLLKDDFFTNHPKAFSCSTTRGKSVEFLVFVVLHSLKRTYSTLKICHSKRKLVFQPSIFRRHVGFRECVCLASLCFDDHLKSGWRLHSTWVTIGFVWTKCFQIFLKRLLYLAFIWKTSYYLLQKKRCGEKGRMGFQHHIWRAQDDGQGWNSSLKIIHNSQMLVIYICAAFRKILIGTTVEGAMDEARSPRCGVWKRRIQGGKTRCILPQWSFLGGVGMFVELRADL